VNLGEGAPPLVLLSLVSSLVLTRLDYDGVTLAAWYPDVRACGLVFSRTCLSGSSLC